MKNIVFLFSLMFSNTILAQSSIMPVECGTMQDLTKVLAEYDEKPFAIAETIREDKGKIIQNHVLFFINTKTKTWTVAEKIKDNIYCVISAGQNFSLITVEKGI